jgi:gliding motility-associated-like protein
MKYLLTCILIFSAFSYTHAQQRACPPNIGFEEGSFNHWQCYAGLVDENGGVNVLPCPPDPNRHFVASNIYPPMVDPYGQFPINCPNGSGYSVQLGNSQTGRGAERISYTFQVPANQNEFSVIYHYAVVFQDPQHLSQEQPKFSVKLYDNTTGTTLSCGAFEYVASSNLPGFKQAGFSLVYYKPWSPVTLKLENCAGKSITLEFTTNDCTKGGHFGYAYIDVDENCLSPITGNVYCNGATEVKLVAPFGFSGYSWFNANFSTLLGTTNVLTISPPPPPGTKYALEVIPYVGYGCQDTLYTTIELSPEAFSFNLQSSIITCEGTRADLTDTSLKTGSSPNLSYYYYTDPDGLNYLGSPGYVDTAKTYFIKAVNATGCSEIKPITVIHAPAEIKIKDPPVACYPAIIDITDPAITAGSTPGFQFSYYTDWGLTPLLNPSTITKSGTYTIKATNAFCSIIKPINVEIRTLDNLQTYPQEECGIVDLTATEVTGITGYGYTFTYWKDANCTVPLPSPQSVKQDGTYYLKAKDGYNCTITRSVDVAIKALPDITVVNPAPVIAPTTASLVTTVTPVPGVALSYWKDQLATQPILNPDHITKTGVYYVKATNPNGCSIVKPITVVINPPPPPIFIVPNAFSPNKDGINDVLKASVKGDVTIKEFSIFNRWGQLVFQTRTLGKSWDGTFKGKELPNGTYYWVMEVWDNYYGNSVRQAGAVTVVR